MTREPPRHTWPSILFSLLVLLTIIYVIVDSTRDVKSIGSLVGGLYDAAGRFHGVTDSFSATLDLLLFVSMLGLILLNRAASGVALLVRILAWLFDKDTPELPLEKPYGLTKTLVVLSVAAGGSVLAVNFGP